MKNILQIIVPSALTFIVGIIIEPFVSSFLYKHKMWKKKSVAQTTFGEGAHITQKIHNDEERKTPRMGGIIVWVSVLIVIIGIYLGSKIVGGIFEDISYFSREQTWIPITVLIGTCLFGLIDDYLVCHDRGTYKGGGLSLSVRLFGVFLIGLFIGLWFYLKLDLTSFYLFSNITVTLGIMTIPLVIITLLSLYAGGIIDGVDGLSGGVFASMYMAYAIIAYSHGQVYLAALCMSIIGGILAFLWFNIPPARFFLSETGSMGLTITLGVIAFLTREIGVLPIIAFPLLVTVLSSIIQIASKKLRNGKKVFLVAPLHNHFQAIGWPSYKVTMRYWIVAIFCSITGVIIALV